MYTYIIKEMEADYMSPLEIVLVSVLGGLIIVAVFYLLVFHTNKNNRLQLFNVINQTAKKNAIVFFGDSLTDFFPIQDFFPDQVIYNRGIAGDTTKDLLQRLDNIIEIAPSKIFIQIGTNDLGKAKSPDKIVRNIVKLYQTLQDKIPGVKLYAISLYPVSHHKMWLSPIIAGIRSNKRIREVNFMLKRVCEEKNIPYIDLHSKLEDKKGRIHRHYTLEGLHISGLGYSVIAETLREYLPS